MSVRRFSERREFLKFLGLTGAISSVGSAGLFAKSAGGVDLLSNFSVLNPTLKDEVSLASGFKHYSIISWGDVLNQKGDTFGYNNDYTAFFSEGPNEGLLWVNHEYVDPLFVSGFDGKNPKTKEQVIKEQHAVGGSVIRLKRGSSSYWEFQKNHSSNKRIDGTTKIPLIADRPIAGSRVAVGTFANCSGGVTPWGSVLTCEENYQNYYGDREFESEKITKSSKYSWNDHFNRAPEHYGWVVEVNPRSMEAKKLVSLGRFSHEGATVAQAKDGRVVVYSADDKAGECIYKFISDSSSNLHSGTLYVADTESGRWISLDRSTSSKLQSEFKDQTEIFIRTRRAAKLVGGTPLNRPEDIEVQPSTGDVFVSLTNNVEANDYFGSILKIQELNSDPGSLTFKASTFAFGGDDTGFACPDNLAFDGHGNLWVTSDMSAKAIGKKPYSSFGNNSLFLVPVEGRHAGRFLRVASGPVGSELTGPSFSADGKTLFVAVQHPGEGSKSLDSLKSHWPEGGSSIPKPGVVAIESQYF